MERHQMSLILMLGRSVCAPPCPTLCGWN